MDYLAVDKTKNNLLAQFSCKKENHFTHLLTIGLLHYKLVD